MYRLLASAGKIKNIKKKQDERWLDPYELRSAALERDLTNSELFSVLINLSTRRGFKSNRKTDKKDSELKGQKKRQDDLQAALGDKTLGQYLYSLSISGNGRLRFRTDSPFFPTRAMYEDEFSRIRARQESVHPDIDWDKAYRIIFFQRPLKRPDRGNCTFFSGEKRGYQCQPSAQFFRIVQDIMNLNYPDAHGQTVELTNGQREWLLSKLFTQQSVHFNAIRAQFHTDAIFNLESKTRTELKGNTTSIKMSQLMGPAWNKLSMENQDALLEALIIDDDTANLERLLKEFYCPEDRINIVLSFDPPVGTASTSTKFMRECSQIMQERWIRYDEAVLAMNLHHSDLPAPASRTELPYYGEILRYSTVLPKPTSKLTDAEAKDPEMIFGRIPNPTVHIALNQLRKLANALIQRYGRPDEVVFEFATDLKKGRAALDAIMKRQAENKKKNDYIKKELCTLRGLGDEYHPARSDIRRYILWEELGGDSQAGRACLYCGKTISASQLLNDEAEIEHIIPFSRCLDDGMSNLTVAHKRCNLEKGNRTPFEAFGDSPKGYSWQDIVQRASKLNWRKRTRFSPKAVEILQEKADFITSQLTDTAYIAKAARDYFACVCPQNKIWAIPGQLTAIFRDQWGLNTVLSSGLGKNRSDHRHHAIDAVVIGLTDRGLLNEAARVNAREDMTKVRAPGFPLERDEVVDKIKKMLVSIKPDHGVGGALLDGTAYGFRKDEHGNPCHYTVRKDIQSLTLAELNDRIINTALKRKIQAHVQEAGLSLESCDKKKLETALSEFSQQYGIKRVKIEAKNASGYKHLEPGIGNRDGHKAYQYSDYLCVDIWQIKTTPKAKYTGEFISRSEVPAGLDNPPRKRPKEFPGARFLMRLYKNDIIQIVHSGKFTYSRVAGYAATTNKLDLRSLFAADDNKAWLEKTNPILLDGYWRPQSGQNFISINVIFQQENTGDRIIKTAITVDGHKRCR